MKYKSDMVTQVIQLLGGLMAVGLFSSMLAIIAFLINFLILGWP